MAQASLDPPCHPLAPLPPPDPTRCPLPLPRSTAWQLTNSCVGETNCCPSQDTAPPCPPNMVQCLGTVGYCYDGENMYSTYWLPEYDNCDEQGGGGMTPGQWQAEDQVYAWKRSSGQETLAFICQAFICQGRGKHFCRRQSPLLQRHHLS